MKGFYIMKKFLCAVTVAFMLIQLMACPALAVSLPTLGNWANEEMGLLPSEFDFTINEPVSVQAYKFSLYKDGALVDANIVEFHGDNLMGLQFDDFAEPIIENGSGSYRVKIGVLDKPMSEYYSYENEMDVPVVAETGMSEAFVYTAPTVRYQTPTSLNVTNNVLTYKYVNGEGTHHDVECCIQYPDGSEFSCGGRGGSSYEPVDISDSIEGFKETAARFETYDPVRYDSTKARFVIKVVVRPWNILAALPSNPAMLYLSNVKAEPASKAESKQPQTGNGISVNINGSVVDFDQPPVNENGRILVPLRAIFETLGADIQWDGDSQTVTATKGELQVSFTVGVALMNVNGKVISLDVPAKIVNGRTLVPVRAISEAFGCNVGWNQDTQTVLITY